MRGDDALDVIHRAERIVWVAGWRLQEQVVLQQLAGTRGLACGSYGTALAAAEALAQARGEEIRC
jgi:protein-disulfide isomerase-like protein with CxxC motif